MMSIVHSITRLQRITEKNTQLLLGEGLLIFISITRLLIFINISEGGRMTPYPAELGFSSLSSRISNK